MQANGYKCQLPQYLKVTQFFPGQFKEIFKMNDLVYYEQDQTDPSYQFIS